jgi:hypothetical protein
VTAGKLARLSERWEKVRHQNAAHDPSTRLVDALRSGWPQALDIALGHRLAEGAGGNEGTDAIVVIAQNLFEDVLVMLSDRG